MNKLKIQVLYFGCNSSWLGKGVLFALCFGRSSKPSNIQHWWSGWSDKTIIKWPWQLSYFFPLFQNILHNISLDVIVSVAPKTLSRSPQLCDIIGANLFKILRWGKSILVGFWWVEYITVGQEEKCEQPGAWDTVSMRSMDAEIETSFSTTYPTALWLADLLD